jgi:phosphohistidine phosphatase
MGRYTTAERCDVRGAECGVRFSRVAASASHIAPRTMRVYLVHHADAVAPDVDSQRPLSPLGRRQADALAAQLKAADCAPAAIWHSGKLRARETAEAMLRACNPFAEFKMVRGLRPEDPPEWMRDVLTAESRDVMIVGHMPSLPAIAALLSGEVSQFPLHGALCFERAEHADAFSVISRFSP